MARNKKIAEKRQPAIDAANKELERIAKVQEFFDVEAAIRDAAATKAAELQAMITEEIIQAKT